jgi:hypothetical protein
MMKLSHKMPNANMSNDSSNVIPQSKHIPTTREIAKRRRKYLPDNLPSAKSITYGRIREAMR